MKVWVLNTNVPKDKLYKTISEKNHHFHKVIWSYTTLPAYGHIRNSGNIYGNIFSSSSLKSSVAGLQYSDMSKLFSFLNLSHSQNVFVVFIFIQRGSADYHTWGVPVLLPLDCHSSSHLYILSGPKYFQNAIYYQRDMSHTSEGFEAGISNVYFDFQRG